MGADKLLAQYTMERDAALRSLDEGTIRTHAARHGVQMPQDTETFWGAVHKARAALETLNDQEREVSRLWLKYHGFREMAT